MTLPERPSGQDLVDLVAAAVAANASITAKHEIALISEVLGEASWVTGPGDDGAAMYVDGRAVIACGEALFPPFVAADPRGAGIAAILANVNDVAAMGGSPLAIVDTIVADRDTAREVLQGMRWAAELYRVPIVGGHLTVREGPPSVSAFAVGRAESADGVLSSTNAVPGQQLIVAACVEGSMREDFPFFVSFDERGERLADDVRVLAMIGGQGLARAAKDISMAGLIGSLAMLLEWGGLGVTVDLDVLPTPSNVDVARWCNCFPCFGFLLTCEPSTTEACCAAFHERGLAAAVVGTLDDSGQIRVASAGYERTVMDLRQTPATGIARTYADDNISS